MLALTRCHAAACLPLCLALLAQGLSPCGWRFRVDMNQLEAPNWYLGRCWVRLVAPAAGTQRVRRQEAKLSCGSRGGGVLARAGQA